MLKNSVISILLTLFCGFSVFKAHSYTITGNISDIDGYEIAFVLVKDTISKSSAYSSVTGSYTLNVASGKRVIKFSSLGYADVIKVLNVSSDTTLNIVMTPAVVNEDKVTLSGGGDTEVEESLNSVEMSTEELTAEEIKEVPAFLGEPDVIKTIQLLPGVTTVGEGATGFNVRGGNICLLYTSDAADD